MVLLHVCSILKPWTEKWRAPGQEEGNMMGPPSGSHSICSFVTHILPTKASHAAKPDIRQAMKRQWVLWMISQPAYSLVWPGSVTFPKSVFSAVMSSPHGIVESMRQHLLKGLPRHLPPLQDPKAFSLTLTALQTSLYRGKAHHDLRWQMTGDKY